jgi:hypothetical protein
MDKMNYLTITRIIIVLGGLFAVIAAAQDQAPTSVTDWLTTDVGSKESILGARVTSVEHSADTDTTIVELEVPVDDPEVIENITVIGRNTGLPIEQSTEAEWLTEYENGHYGIRIHMKRPAGFDFLIRFVDSDPMKNR